MHCFSSTNHASWMAKPWELQYTHDVLLKVQIFSKIEIILRFILPDPIKFTFDQDSYGANNILSLRWYVMTALWYWIQYIVWVHANHALSQQEVISFIHLINTQIWRGTVRETRPANACTKTICRTSSNRWKARTCTMACSGCIQINWRSERRARNHCYRYYSTSARGISTIVQNVGRGRIWVASCREDRGEEGTLRKILKVSSGYDWKRE